MSTKQQNSDSSLRIMSIFCAVGCAALAGGTMWAAGEFAGGSNDAYYTDRIPTLSPQEIDAVRDMSNKDRALMAAFWAGVAGFGAASLMGGVGCNTEEEDGNFPEGYDTPANG